MFRFAFYLCLLYSGYAYLILALGLLGACNPPVIGFSLAIPAAGLAWLAMRERGRWATLKDHLPLLAVLGILALLYSHALLVPPYMRDDMIYHLLVPKQMALTGKLAFDPFNINSNFPMLFEMPLAALETLGRPVSPFAVNVGFALLLAASLYACLGRYAGVSKAQAAAVVAAFGTLPVLFDLLRSGYVEVFFALLILLATLFYFRHLGDGTRHDFLRACACLGLAAAVKYPGCIFALLFIGCEWFRSRERRRLYAGALLCALLAAPWYVKSWVLTGNPVFPFLNTIFASSFISRDRFEGFHHMLVDYHMGRTWEDYLLLPGRLALGMDARIPGGGLGFDGRLSLLFAAAVAGLGWRDRQQGFASLVFLAYFAIWAAESQQARLLLPILPLTLPFALRRLAPLRWRAVCIYLGAAAILAQDAGNISVTLRRDGIARLLAGKLDRDAFLAAQLPVSYPLARDINARLDARRHRLMTVGSFGRNYYFDIPVLTNTFFDQEIFRRAFERDRLRPDSATAFLDANRVTHVLFNWDFVEKMHSRDAGFDLPALREYWGRVGRVAYGEGNLVLYERLEKP